MVELATLLALPQKRLVSQEMAQLLLRFVRKQQPGVVRDWLVRNAGDLLQHDVLNADTWAETLLQEPLLLLVHPSYRTLSPDGWTHRTDAPELPLAVPRLPAEQQVAVVRAALQHWHGKVGSLVLGACPGCCSCM